MLTGFNGTTISYDGAGNPTSYTNGKTDYRFEWVKGRSLQYAAIMGDEQLQAFYEYDADGIRNFKDVDGMAHNYITQNGKVVRETIGSGSTAKILDFIYDESGKPFALKYSTNGGSSFGKYYYVLNLQGDVVKLVNTSGTVVANYTYNAWGEVLTATGNMAAINPLRYRGYYYDTETGFYYLQSRYYDPATHRFINADSYASTGQGIIGTNMFAYCRNSPVKRSDFSGTYDRDAAVNYATQWGESANDNYPNFTGKGGDCTNFVSQCLFAGGIKQTEDWYCKKRWWIGRIINFSFTTTYSHRAWRNSTEWSCANVNFDYVAENYRNGEAIRITEASQIQEILGEYTIQKGDLLYWSNDRGIHHAAIITDIQDGEIYYAAHSGPHTRQALSEKIGSETVYIVMINDNAT